jgi:hypothetical protein
MTYAKKLYLIAAGAIIVLSAGTASAQDYRPGMGVYRDSRPPDPEQGAKRKAVDDAYKSLMEKIPDNKKSYDPWGNIRSTTTTSSKSDERKPRQPPR